MNGNLSKSTVLGIISIALGVICFFIFWWLSAAAIVLGIIGLCSEGNKACSTIGLILGVVMLVLSIIGLCSY